jgi:hypothetical protein
MDSTSTASTVLTSVGRLRAIRVTLVSFGLYMFVYIILSDEDFNGSGQIIKWAIATRAYARAYGHTTLLSSSSWPVFSVYRPHTTAIQAKLKTEWVLKVYKSYVASSSLVFIASCWISSVVSSESGLLRWELLWRFALWKLKSWYFSISSSKRVPLKSSVAAHYIPSATCLQHTHNARRTKICTYRQLRTKY